MLDTIKSVLAERRGNRRKLFNVVFSTDEGERVFRYICKLAHIGNSTYVKGDHDRTMMNEGARNLALLLSVVFVFLVMGVVLESWLLPLTVLTTVPMAIMTTRKPFHSRDCRSMVIHLVPRRTC